MKPITTKLRAFFFFSLFFAVRSFVLAQGQAPSGVAVNGPASSANSFAIVQRAPDSRVWQQAIITTNAEGDISTNLQSYTELATGLCYTNAAGQLVDSVEQVELVAGGAQAVQGRHKVQWGADLETPVTIQTEDGKTLTCKVFGLAYYDLSSGSNAAIGRLQDSQGSLLPPNAVFYQNAFSNITADLLYTYTKAGLSQDVVFRQAPPPPDAYGLSDSNSILQIYTQWFGTPEPSATAVTNEGVLDDQVLSFGTMQMGVGTSLFFDGNGASLSLGNVNKQWIHINSNTYLVESVPWTSISNQVSQLHPASNLNPKRASIRGLALLDGEQKAGDFKTSPKQKDAMRIAKASIGGKRLVMDYEILTGTTNITLQGDQTFLISGTVNFTNVLTIEGGSVVKFTNLAQINVTGPASNIVCQTGPYRPSVWTSINDNSVGVTLPYSTGTPSVATNTYLNFTLANAQAMTLRYLRFSYANTAIAGPASSSVATNWIKLWDCQFYDCGTAFSSTGNGTVDVYAYNLLFSQVTNGLSASATNATTYVTTQNVTADNMQNFTWNIYIGNVSTVNSVFTGVANLPWTSLTTNCAVYSTSNGVYATVGAANYYLNSGSTNRAKGTTSIDSGLLADLGTLTTYPPVVILGYIQSNTNFTAQPIRNTGTPDRGYHYFPIDYAVNAAVSNSTVTVQPGTVVAGYGSYALWLWENGVISSAGTATMPVWMVRYNTVQEQSNTNWQSANWNGCLVTPAATDSSAAAFTFTDWSVLGGDSLVLTSSGVPFTVPFANCQFYNGQIKLSDQTLVSTNCLYQRVFWSIVESGGWTEANTCYNNLFLDGSFTVKHSGTGIWTFCDNLFDQVLISTNSGKPIDICSNNAYMTNLSVTTLTNLLPNNHDVFLTSSPSYLIGGFGQFYYPVTQTSLITNGSRSATNAGLSFYTTCINNVADGANKVSIGYHFPSQPPRINTQPTNVATTVGGTAAFSVGATGVGTLTYQWYFNGMPVSGQTSSSLTISPVEATNAGTYEVIITDPLGSTASYFVTLKTAQNDFYVNYFSSSPINAMVRGEDDNVLDVAPYSQLVPQTAAGASIRGVALGTDADTYNWMTLHSQANDYSYTDDGYCYGCGGENAGYSLPLTTLQFLEDACISGATPIITVNAIGTGTNVATGVNPDGQTNYLVYCTNSAISNPQFFASLASNWVIYCNLIVPYYCWSNGIIVPITNNVPYNTFTNASDPYYSSFTNIMTNLVSNWSEPGNGSSLHQTNLPTLITNTMLTANTNYFNMPKVKYWEIGNEVEGVAGATNTYTNSPSFTKSTFAATNYDVIYKSLRSAIKSVDSTLNVGPGFGGNDGGNNIIGPFMQDPSVTNDFMVYHPYYGNLDPDWTGGNTAALSTNLEFITYFQDLVRIHMYNPLAANGRSVSIPLLGTEWNPDYLTGITNFQESMWELLGITETCLSMVKGQQTSAANYYIDNTVYTNQSDWPLIFGRLQTNLGNMFLSSSFGDGVPALYYPTVNSSLPGSSESPIRVYSTLDTNSGTISVWMLNLTNSGNQTVDLHFPGAIASGTLFTLTNSSLAPNLTNQGLFNRGDIIWYTNSISSTSGSSIVETIPPATLMVAQVTLSTTPVQPSVPIILAMPSLGQPGQVITIDGNNFSPNAQQNVVYFGPVRGTVINANSNALSVQVPYGASYAPVTVTVNNLTVYSPNYFNPAYYGASVTNPIVMQSATNYAFANPIEGGNLLLTDMGLMDINGDGKPDLMFVGGYLSNSVETNLGSVSLYLNGSTGTSNFTLLTNAPFTQPATYLPGLMAFGDFDGDGLPDWTWVNGDRIMVGANASTPQGTQSSRFNQYLTGNGPWGIAVADFDGDGKPDIVVANQTDGTVSVFRNLSSGTGNLIFAQKVDFRACTNATYLAVADFNGDGKPDIAVVGYGQSGAWPIIILTNNSTVGKLNFTNAITVANLGVPTSIAVGDFNMDGKPDIAVSSDGSSFGVYVYTNNSSIGSVSFGLLANLNTVSGPYGISISDLNGDGLPDLAVADGLSAVSVFRNNGNGSFGLRQGCSLPSGANPIGLVIGDIDGDGRPDFAVGNYDTTNIVIFQNASQY